MNVTKSLCGGQNQISSQSVSPSLSREWIRRREYKLSTILVIGKKNLDSAASIPIGEPAVPWGIGIRHNNNDHKVLLVTPVYFTHFLLISVFYMVRKLSLSQNY